MKSKTGDCRGLIQVLGWFSIFCLPLPLVTAQPTGLVAAYSCNEGSGTTVGDVSGNGNNGTVASGTWTASGKYGNALTFNGTSTRVTVADANSLDLTGGMTLEAWVYPTAGGGWRDVVYKGPNDIYYLMGSSDNGAPAVGGTFTTALKGTGNLSLNTWTHLAGTYDGATLRLYLNGVQVVSRAQTGAIVNSTGSLTIGSDALYGQYFAGRIDEVRIYNRALNATEITTDMNTPVGGAAESVPPSVTISSPINNAQLNDTVSVTADASDNAGVGGVQFLVDDVAVGFEDTDSPYGIIWDTRSVANGPHTLTARARDTSGNMTTSAPVNISVANGNFFQNEILATGFALPTSIKFLPDSRMLVAELAGTIKVLPPPYTTPDPAPFLQLNLNIPGYAGLQQGIFDVMLDPNFAVNHYYYLFYTKDSPNRDRLSRFTANAALNGTASGSEVILYEDPQTPNTEHHGGAINFL